LRYAQKTEIIAQLDKLETKIEKLINQVDSLKSK
jgi:regulator of replication initiation timing